MVMHRPYHRFSMARSIQMDERKARTTPSADVPWYLQPVWQATEVLGNLASLGRPDEDDDGDAIDRSSPLRWEALVEALRKDYESAYFITGQLDRSIYEEDCEFADPFASFRGLTRFQNNLRNLAPFIEDPKLTLLDFTADEDDLEVRTLVRISLTLKLPWRPRIGWRWGVRYGINPESGRVCLHREEWSVTAEEGVRQLFRMGSRPPRR